MAKVIRKKIAAISGGSVIAGESSVVMISERKDMYLFNKKETSIFGLAYVPILKNCDMDADSGPFNHSKRIPNPYGFQDIDKIALRNEIKRMGANLKTIVEIGVSIQAEEDIAKGSTYTILNNKPKDAIYLGIDISDHGGWVAQHDNCHFVRADSSNIIGIESKMKELGIETIDLFLIDGWHSVNKVIDEWRQYTKRLSKHGSVVMHDISIHPSGLVFDAIDDLLFDKVKYESDQSYGLGIATRK